MRRWWCSASGGGHRDSYTLQVASLQAARCTHPWQVRGHVPKPRVLRPKALALPAQFSHELGGCACAMGSCGRCCSPQAHPTLVVCMSALYARVQHSRQPTLKCLLVHLWCLLSLLALKVCAFACVHTCKRAHAHHVGCTPHSSPNDTAIKHAGTANGVHEGRYKHACTHACLQVCTRARKQPASTRLHATAYALARSPGTREQDGLPLGRDGAHAPPGPPLVGAHAPSLRHARG